MIDGLLDVAHYLLALLLSHKCAIGEARYAYRLIVAYNSYANAHLSLGNNQGLQTTELRIADLYWFKGAWCVTES